MVAYPLPNFPGRTQENLLGQLLRKKLEQMLKTGLKADVRPLPEAMETGDGGLKEHELLDLWEWAGMAANEQAKHTWETISPWKRGDGNRECGHWAAAEV
jgi:mediator of RNA polymerase II transcription subunit 8